MKIVRYVNIRQAVIVNITYINSQSIANLAVEYPCL